MWSISLHKDAGAFGHQQVNAQITQGMLLILEKRIQQHLILGNSLSIFDYLFEVK